LWAGRGTCYHPSMTAISDDEETPITAYRWVVLAGVWLVYFCFGLTTASLAPIVAPVATRNHARTESLISTFAA